ncbi:hypothetical protein [Iningainema tapete]|nr:hypothetical protein [Iningainema tapete]
MHPLEASELKAFILALSRLKAPLPADVQARVNQINIPADIGKLYDVAMSYPPLAKSYEQVCEYLDTIIKQRSKGVDFLPEPEPEEFNTEIDNSAVEIIQVLVEFDKKFDNNKLTEIARKITKALNSVSSARDVIQTIIF